jgi:hypothetical protein
LGLTLWPPTVADKTHEIPVLEDVWRGWVVEGRVITVDALLTQPPSPNASCKVAALM